LHVEHAAAEDGRVDTPQTKYAKTVDGVNIAYQVRGAGPVDLIYATGWTGNLEVALEGRRSAAYFGGLASFSRLILFDKRGTGLSDRTRTPDLEMRADDLRGGARSRWLRTCGRDG
jgi:pimeloyl-ACP methyl ester carboxylesterase